MSRFPAFNGPVPNIAFPLVPLSRSSRFPALSRFPASECTPSLAVPVGRVVVRSGPAQRLGVVTDSRGYGGRRRQRGERPERNPGEVVTSGRRDLGPVVLPPLSGSSPGIVSMGAQSGAVLAVRLNVLVDARTECTLRMFVQLMGPDLFVVPRFLFYAVRSGRGNRVVEPTDIRFYPLICRDVLIGRGVPCAAEAHDNFLHRLPPRWLVERQIAET